MKNKKDILVEERDKLLTKAVKIEIDIATLETSDPNGIVAKDKRPLAKDKQGQVISYQEHDVTCKELIERYKSEAEGINKVIAVIDKMIKNEKGSA